MEEQLHNLMMQLEGKERIDAQQTTELFNLNNAFFPDLREHNKSCPACRERIYNRLKTLWLNTIKNKMTK